MMPEINKNKILIVDDNESIHNDFRKILESNARHSVLEENEAILFNKPVQSALNYRIDSAYQGQEALELVKQSIVSGEHYSLAFVDILMPPGWNGIETIKRIWEVEPNIQMVICSAHSDYSWEEISQTLGNTDKFLILKKPFEVIEIRQLAAALTRKWMLNKELQYHIENLEKLVRLKTIDLEKSLSLTNSTLESTADGIIVIQHDQEILKYNKLFLELWGLSEDYVQSTNGNLIFEKLAEQVDQSKFFLDSIANFNFSRELGFECTREWRLKGGKVFESYKHPYHLNNEIIGMVCSFRDITERKTLEEQLLYQATHDSLTNLPNRILLEDRFQQMILQAKRYKIYSGLLLIDLDNFKAINDTLGHPVGDSLLVAVAERLKKHIRESDTIARFGGDEFVVLFAPVPNKENFTDFIDRILEVFERPFQVKEHEITIKASIGASIYPEDGQNYDDLLKNADIALYRAKESGRNNCQFYFPEFNKDIMEKAELEESLTTALQSNEFVLHYQPLVELKTNKILGFEALLGWQHPELGLVMPEKFIPLAGKMGLLIPIGEWVLRTACSQTKAWHNEGFQELSVTVDISNYHFQKTDFVGLIKRILKEVGLPPQSLELAITESVLITEFLDYINKMQELKTLGVRLSINDFGTGYANLSSLKYFPFDKIVIDKTFVDEIISSSNDGYIVEAILSMSKKLSKEVLAEGIENKEQIKNLRNLHSDQVQGYYFSHPIEEKKCTELLKKGLKLS